MQTTYFLIIAVLLLANILLMIVLFKRGTKSGSIDLKMDSLEKMLERVQNLTLNELSNNRIEVQNSMNVLNGSISKQLSDFSAFQKSQFDSFSQLMVSLTNSNEQRLERIRNIVDEKLSQIQSQNEQKLEQIRQTVDDRLQSTLEAKLGESFRIVSERLELVHKGLGEMQALANGVGDLKKVLSNVKTRGTLGEIQLGNIIDDILTADQYVKNIRIKNNTQESVEFAIKIPSQNAENGEFIYLPIDSKFPVESYQRLIDAHEKNDVELVAKSIKELEISIKQNAKIIREKYIDPPKTTDFAIMFLPTEGLYAEVLRIPGLFENVQKDYRVVIAGPTTIAAILNSLALGFKTIAIEKRTSEVWQILSAIKTEFARFGEMLDKVKKKLSEAQDSIDTASKKTRTIERKLRNVESLTSNDEAEKILYSVDVEEN